MAQTKKKSRRNRLLGAIHAEKKRLGVSDAAYEDMKFVNFGVESAADLNDAELTSLLEMMTRRRQGYGGQASYQVEALKEKIEQMILHSNLSPERVRGLVKSVCGVDDLRWYSGGPKLLKTLIPRLRTIIEGDEEGKS